MVAFDPKKPASQATDTGQQESAQPSGPSIDRAEMFARMRAASEQRVSTGIPLASPSASLTPPSVPHERVLEVEKRAQDLYRSMHGGLTGWGTDEAQLLNALKGLSPAETQLLKEVYAQHFNTELGKDITSELSGADVAQARAALRGDRAVETAAALYRAMDGIGTDQEAIVATLSGLSAEEQVQVARVYRETYGQDLDATLRSELSGDDLRRATALRQGKPLTAAAVELHQSMSGLGSDEAAINAVMRRYPPEQMQAVAREYHQLYGVPLQRELTSELSGNDLRESVALMHGDSTAAKVAQLRGGLEGLGTSEETIFSVLDGTTAAEREGLKAAFLAQTGTSLELALQIELSGAELERANALLANGKLADVEILRFAVLGFGTDEATITEVLRDRSKEEVALLTKDYEARYHESLESRIQDELGGRDEFRSIQALKGRPTTIDEALKNVQERDAFERSGMLSGVIGALSKEDDRIQQQLVAARSDIAAAKKDGAITAEERATIERSLRFAEGNIDVHVETRDAIAETGATVAAIAGSTAVVIGTGGLATPGVVALAATTGGASYAGTKYAVKGHGYDGEGLASDIGIGAIEGTITALTAGTATAVKNTAQQGAMQAVTTASKTAVRETVVESTGATAQDAMRPDTWAGGAPAGVATLAVSAASTAITSGIFHRTGVSQPPRMRDEVAVTTQVDTIPAGSNAMHGAQHPLTPTIENPANDGVVDLMHIRRADDLSAAAFKKEWQHKDLTYARWEKQGRILTEDGIPSALTAKEYELVRSAEFKEWFGDWQNQNHQISPVVIEPLTGEPKIWFRGDKSAQFDNYQIKPEVERTPQTHHLHNWETIADKRNQGVFFTNSRETALFYANDIHSYTLGNYVLHQEASHPKTFTAMRDWLQSIANVDPYFWRDSLRTPRMDAISSKERVEDLVRDYGLSTDMAADVEQSMISGRLLQHSPKEVIDSIVNQGRFEKLLDSFAHQRSVSVGDYEHHMKHEFGQRRSFSRFGSLGTAQWEQQFYQAYLDYKYEPCVMSRCFIKSNNPAIMERIGNNNPEVFAARKEGHDVVLNKYAVGSGRHDEIIVFELDSIRVIAKDPLAKEERTHK